MKQKDHQHATVKRTVFPAPAYLTMPSIGFDISDRSIKYVDLMRSGNEIHIRRYGKIAIEPGIIDAGIIKKEKEFIEILENLHRQLHIRFVRVSLPEEHIFSFEMELPRIERSQMRGAIEIRIQDEVPYTAEELIFDFEIILNDPQWVLIQVSAIRREIAETYIDAIRKAGLFPLSLELESQALVRGIISREEKGACMIVDLGETRIGIAVSQDNHIYHTSTFALDNKGLEEISHNETEVLFNELPQEIQLRFQAIAQNILEHIRYWESHRNDSKHPKKELSKIILSGGVSNSRELVNFLQKTLPLETHVCDPFMNISKKLLRRQTQMNVDEALSYTTAIGLARGDYLYD